MIPTWPPKPQYEAEKRLREAIDTTTYADALAVNTLIHTAKKVENGQF